MRKRREQRVALVCFVKSETTRGERELYVLIHHVNALLRL